MSEPALKCEKYAIFKQNYTQELFISFKISYSRCFGFRGNLEFPDFLQKKDLGHRLLVTMLLVLYFSGLCFVFSSSIWNGIWTYDLNHPQQLLQLPKLFTELVEGWFYFLIWSWFFDRLKVFAIANYDVKHFGRLYRVLSLSLSLSLSLLWIPHLPHTNYLSLSFFFFDPSLWLYLSLSDFFSLFTTLSTPHTLPQSLSLSLSLYLSVLIFLSWGKQVSEF